MKVAIIGRSEFLYETTKTILNNGYKVPLIISAKETIDYKVGIDDFHKLAKKNRG